MWAAYSPEAFSLRIPHTFRFLVIEYKGIVIGPSGRGESEGGTVKLAAVHSRQVDQWSVTCRYGLPGYRGVGDFMPPQAINPIGVRLSINCYTDYPVARGPG